MAFSYLRQIWQNHQAQDKEGEEDSRGSRGFILTHKGVPYSKMALPTRSLIDQKNPHKYRPACNTDVVDSWREKQ